MKRVIVFFFLSAALAALHGCALTKGVVSQGVDINKSIEDSENKIIVMNILRARDHMPMYFSSISSFNGSLPNVSGGLGFSFPFGGDAFHEYKLTPGLNASGSLSYTIANLNTHQFMRGISKPIDGKTFKYYWDMGWPKALLMHLFVESIKLYTIQKDEKGNVVGMLSERVYENYPLKIDKYNKFSSEINLMIKDGLFSGYNEKYVPDKEGKFAVEKDVYFAQVKNIGNINSEESSFIFKKKYTLTLPPEKKSKCENNKLAVVYLRSPEALIYYLGEIVRYQLKGNNNDLIRVKIDGDPDSDPEPIFVLEEGHDFSGKDSSFVDVEYNGKKYSMPKTYHGKSVRSSEVLSLLTQLIGVYKYSEEMPRTPTVRLIE